MNGMCAFYQSQNVKWCTHQLHYAADIIRKQTLRIWG